MVQLISCTYSMVQAVIVCLVLDRSAEQIQDGVRYQASLRLRIKLGDDIVSKRAAIKENNKVTKAVKKAKATYIVDAAKFASTATEEQLALDLTEADLGTKDTHKILQCKIR